MKLEDTYYNCDCNPMKTLAYLRGDRVPNFPLPVHRNMDIDSKYWYWFHITTILFWVKNTK